VLCSSKYIKPIRVIFYKQPLIHPIILVNRHYSCRTYRLTSVGCMLHCMKVESNTFSTEPQSHKQISLQCDDQADSHQTQTWMKDKAPPIQLLYVPLLAAEFIKLSMWGEIKAPVLGDFPLLAYCLNMTASVFEHSTNAWLRAYSHQASDPISCRLSTHRWKFLLFFDFFFSFSSMLVKRYIQLWKYAFDRDEKLIYGFSSSLTHCLLPQALCPVQRVFWGGNHLL